MAPGQARQSGRAAPFDSTCCSGSSSKFGWNPSRVYMFRSRNGAASPALMSTRAHSPSPGRLVRKSPLRTVATRMTGIPLELLIRLIERAASDTGDCDQVRPDAVIFQQDRQGSARVAARLEVDRARDINPAPPHRLRLPRIGHFQPVAYIGLSRQHPAGRQPQKEHGRQQRPEKNRGPWHEPDFIYVFAVVPAAIALPCNECEQRRNSPERGHDRSRIVHILHLPPTSRKSKRRLMPANHSRISNAEAHFIGSTNAEEPAE